MARADADELGCLARWLEEKHAVSVLKEPARTLVMLPMREPVRGTPFYIGELLATEAMVEIEGARGMGVCMGAEDEKALSMAVIDASFNAGLEECRWLTEKLESMELRQNREIAKETALHLSTKVTFNTLEGQ